MSLLPTTNEWASHQVYVKAKKMVQKQDEELATLRQQLAEAQRDAARYRWLRDDATKETREWITKQSITTLDAAIDAAIKQTK